MAYQPHRAILEPSDDGQGMNSRGGKIKSLIAVLISLVILIGGVGFSYTHVLHKVISFGIVQDYEGDGEADITFTIPSGATVTQIGEMLAKSDIVKSEKAFAYAARKNKDASNIQAGTYQMKTKMSAHSALEALLDTDNLVNNQVTIPEGLRNSSVVLLLNENTGIAAEDFDKALADTSVLGLPDWARDNAEGFLFPDTYSYDAESTATSLLKMMPKQFNSVSESIDFVNKAKALGVDPYDALIVASIIEKETRDPKYGPDIAQVIYNRLKIGMPLQLDSTVIYAVNSPGTITTTDEERNSDSPYNTYKHKGLPPGPISNPGKNSLEAAVNPSGSDYLYFVATDPETGETKFASDDAGHARNVEEFQSWCRLHSDICG